MVSSGTTSGQEILTVKGDGNFGVRTSSPSAALHVVGEVRTTNAAGSGRVWGEGRPSAVRYGTSGVESGLCANGAISFGLSYGIAEWSGAQASCPVGTWLAPRLSARQGPAITPDPTAPSTGRPAAIPTRTMPRARTSAGLPTWPPKPPAAGASLKVEPPMPRERAI